MTDSNPVSGSAANPAATGTARHTHQSKPKKPIWKKWWFWVIIVVAVLAIAGMGGNNNSQSGSSTATSSSAQNVAPKSTPKKNAKLTGITAAYNGSIKDGEQVTDQTSGITVTAKYDDGTTKNVTGWKIQNPGAVNINAPTEFTVENTPIAVASPSESPALERT